MLLLHPPIATDKGTKIGRLWGKDEDVVVVEGVAVVIIPDIITSVPSKIRKAIPIKGSCQNHKQPQAITPGIPCHHGLLKRSPW